MVEHTRCKHKKQAVVIPITFSFGSSCRHKIQFLMFRIDRAMYYVVVPGGMHYSIDVYFLPIAIEWVRDRITD